MKVVNLTPHSVTEVISNTTFPPSGKVTRVDTTQKVVKEISLDGADRPITVYKTIYGAVQNLPKPEKDTLFIVSAPVLNALLEKGIHRPDIVAPHKIMRDSGGTPRGCNGFRLNG